MTMSRVLVDRVARERHGRVGRGRQHVGHAGGPDDVRRVAAAGAFRMEGMMVRPLNAANVSSTKPDSLSVSLWIAT